MFSGAFLVIASIAIASTTAVTCPDGGQHFYPHPTRCTKFYECNNGQLAEQQCFGDFVFNPESSICDFPSNVECEDVPDVVTEPPVGPGGPVGTCPDLNNVYVDFLTDASDCAVFYMCRWGEPIKMNCPADLYFNPTLNVCDYAYRAGCTVQQ